MPGDDPEIGGRIPDDILDVARNHWRQLDALEKRSKDAVTRRLQAAADRVRERVRENPESFQAQQARIIELLAEMTRAETEQEMRRIVEQLWRSGSKLAPAHTETELNQWLQHYGHEARPLNLQALAEVDRELLLERFERSLEHWGPAVVEGVKEELADAMAERAFSEDMVDRVQTAIADKRWMADRIVRTELSQAYNRSHHSTLQYARDELGLGDEMKKSAMATFDARTDEDSFPVHGQVREIDEMFVDGDGRRYVHPPGRPNDREKEIPWMGEEGANRLAEMTSDNADTDVGASSSGGQFPPQGPYNDVKPGGRQLTDTGEGEYHGNYRLREDPEDGKTQTQLDERGWSPEDVSDVIAEPTRVYDTRDWRGDDMEPAIAYVREDGDYVVRNERTGYLVQISDRDDPDWLATWDYDVKPP